MVMTFWHAHFLKGGNDLLSTNQGLFGNLTPSVLIFEGIPRVFGEHGNTGNLVVGAREQSNKINGNKRT